MKTQTMINDSRGKQIGWSFAGKFFKHKADAPVTDPLPVFNHTNGLIVKQFQKVLVAFGKMWYIQQ